MSVVGVSFKTKSGISICGCLSMVQLMAVFISMRCTLCGHFLQVALTVFLFFQAEDGIRDRDVTGVQTCALPISLEFVAEYVGLDLIVFVRRDNLRRQRLEIDDRSEERRVGKECRCRWSAYRLKRRVVSVFVGA